MILNQFQRILCQENQILPKVTHCIFTILQACWVFIATQIRKNFWNVVSPFWEIKIERYPWAIHKLDSRLYKLTNFFLIIFLSNCYKKKIYSVVFLTRWTCTIKVFIAILHIFELHTWVRIIVFTLSLFLQFFSQVFTKFPKW